MKKLLSLILAVAMMMTIFCVVPVSAEDAPLDASKVYFFDDFSSATSVDNYSAVKGGASTVTLAPTFEYAADKGINGGGAMKYTFDAGEGSIPYVGFRMANFNTNGSGTSVALPLGATVKLSYKLYVETTISGSLALQVFHNGSGSQAEGSKTGTIYTVNSTHLNTWKSFSATAVVTKTDGTGTYFDYRIPCNAATAGGATVMYIDDLELKVSMDDTKDNNAEYDIPTVTGATGSVASNGTLNLNYTFTENGTATAAGDSSFIRVFDGTTLIGQYQAGSSFTVPEANRTSDNLTAVITPISGWGYLNPTDVEVEIAPAVIESTNISDIYYFNDFSNGIDGITVHANGSTAYAADKGVNGTGALKLTVGSGKYGNIRIPVFMPEYIDIPQGAKIVLKAKVKYESTMTSNISFGMISTTAANNGNDFTGSGASIPLATSTTQWTDITMTSATQQSTNGSNTRFEFRLNGGAATSDGSDAVFYLDDLEMKIVYADSAELAAPSVTGATASVAANGALNLNYTYTSAGSTASTLDASMIKVYDGDVLLGKYQAGGTFTIPEANRTSENLKAIITPISGWGYIGSDVTVAITPLKAVSTDISKVYYYEDFNDGDVSNFFVVGNKNQTASYAADKGIDNTGALKVEYDTTTGSYVRLGFNNFHKSNSAGATMNLPAGARFVIRAKLRFETAIAAQSTFDIYSTAGGGTQTIWGATFINRYVNAPATSWVTVGHKVNAVVTAGDITTDIRLPIPAGAAGETTMTMYIDDIEVIIAMDDEKDGTTMFDVPEVTNVTASVADNGNLNLDYTFTEKGELIGGVDNSVVKIYDGDVFLGTTKKGATFNIPEARRTSANLKVQIVPISGYGYAAVDYVESAITPLVMFEGTTLTKVDGGVTVAAASVTGAKLIFVSYDANFKMISAKFVDVTSVVNAEQTFTFAAAEFEEGVQNKAMLWQDKVNCKPLAAAIAW